jgi:hypothetical protein
MVQEKIVKRISELWEGGTTNENSIIEKIQSEFQVSANDAETMLELTKAGFLRASFIISGKNFPKNNLNNNPIVKKAIQVALSNSGKSELYKKAVKKRRWWKFWK